MLGTIDKHDVSIYSSEADNFSTRGKNLDCVMIYLCHVLVSLPANLILSLNPEVYCPCIDEEYTYFSLILSCVYCPLL